MKKMEKLVAGNWRITGMEVWDADYFDIEGPAHITVHKELTGTFQFGLAQRSPWPLYFCGIEAKMALQ